MGKIAELSRATKLPKGYLFGYTLSNNATITKLDVAAGYCRDATDTFNIKLTNAITAGLIQTSGSWAAGSTQNKLDTGARANTTWYHVHVIRTDANEEGDWLFSLSATTPTMPATYTYSRRIGSCLTDGSGNIIAFKQIGDEFLWAASVLDVNAANPGTSAVSRTLTVPTGIQVGALVNWLMLNSAAGVNAQFYISSLDQTDEAVSQTAAPLASTPNITTASGAVSSGGGVLLVRTNTSAQVRSRLLGSDASVTLRGATLGWIDARGRVS